MKSQNHVDFFDLCLISFIHIICSAGYVKLQQTLFQNSSRRLALRAVVMIFTGIPVGDARGVRGEVAAYQGLLFVGLPELFLACQHPVGNFLPPKMGREFKCLEAICFLFSFSCPRPQ